MTLESIDIRVLDERATIPTRSHATDAGLDLYALETTDVTQGTLIRTGIAVDVPEGYEATVRPRSGLTSRTPFRVQIGTVDSGYNGEVSVIADCYPRHNPFLALNIEPIFEVQAEEKIAQLVISPISTPAVNVVDSFASESDRGSNGFGSTDEQ